MGTALILVSNKKTFVHQLLSIGALQYIGTLSYSLYLWHWSVLVLGKWTIGDAALAKLILLFLVCLIAIFSYYLIEIPLKNIQTFKRNKATIYIAILIATGSSWFVGVELPKHSLSYNNFISKFFGIQQVEQWNVKCHEGVNKLSDPLNYCLGANRTSEKPNVIYLIGESHAAQLFFMVDGASKDSKYEVKFINDDFIFGFINNNKAGPSKTFDFILKNALQGDKIIIAFHRGHLNEDRDKHIPIQQEIKLNDKTNNFIENMDKLVKQFYNKDIKIIFIRDTPLMNVISTSPACALQVKLFEQSVCRVTREQDTHTRYRQDYAFNLLVNSNQNTFVWDPQQLIYGENNYLEPINLGGNYIMYDWNHISQLTSENMSTSFNEYLKSIAPK
jgi:hypothetical protein